MHPRASRFAISCLALCLISAEFDPPPAKAPPKSSAKSHEQSGRERIRAIRGAYISGPALAARTPDGIARMLRRSGLNAAVIDFKDSDGRVLATLSDAEPAPTTAPTPRGVYVGRDKPVTRELLAQLHALGIYTIARIVCFSDPVLPRKEPHRAVLDGRPNKQGQVWADWGKRNTWLDPYHPENQRMVIELAQRAQALGFDEVQLDYIRFPVDSATSFAIFPSKTEHSRTTLLTDLMRRVDAALDIPLGVDVFGTTAFQFEAQDELGQDPAAWMRHVQVFSPMLYMNGMSSYMAPGPRRAERLVRLAVSRMRAQIGPGPVIRPFLQAFSRGADYFTPDFITEQIRGSSTGGADGYLFWEPGGDYRMVREAFHESSQKPLRSGPSQAAR